MPTYSSERLQPSVLWREARYLLARHRNEAEEHVVRKLGLIRDLEAQVEDRYGVQLDGLRVLDVGPGQQLIQLAYFATRNDAVGIDLDVIAQGFDVPAYVRMLRVNGLPRTAKTVVRKALGVDAWYARALREQLGRPKLPPLRVEQMDVTALAYPDVSFDFVYCSSVFQHLSDPALALAEIRRVLRPRGVAYAAFQLYTSDTGSLDPRLVQRDFDELPRWAHLRPATRDSVVGNAYLNRLRLPEWRAVFEAEWPGCIIELSQPQRPELEPIAVELLAAGELDGYTMDELVTHELRVSWQRPG